MAKEQAITSPFAPDEKVLQQLREMNAPAEVIERCELAMGKPVAFTLEVPPDIETSLLVFRLMGTQWNLVMGFAGTRHVGLRYEALPMVMKFAAVPAASREQVFADVRIMEAAALTVLNAAK